MTQNSQKNQQSTQSGGLFRVFLVAVALGHMLVPLPVMAAKPKVKVLVLQTQSEELDADARNAATTLIRDELKKYPGVTLLDTPDGDLFETMIDLECTDYDADCLTKMGRKWRGQRVVFTTIAAADGALELKLILVDVKRGKVIKTASVPAADKAALTAAVGKADVTAFGKPPAPKPKRVSVTITSSETGAKVYLNDTYAGKTPLTKALKPGRYRVKIVKNGFVDGKDTLMVKSGKTQTMHVDMKAAAPPVERPPADPPPVDQPPSTEEETPLYKQWWLWTIVGAVVVGGAVATAVALSQDDDPAPTGALQFGFGTPDQDPLVRAAR